MGALRGMLSFFTMIRVDITQDDTDAMDRKFWMVPVIGALYGLIAAAMMTFLAGYIGIDPLVSSAVTFFAIFGFNRFLHIDGMIDVGDGLVVAGTKEDHLRALKDTRIGAGGTAFAVMIIFITITAAASIPIAMMALLLFSSEVMAKVGMVSAAAFGTPGDGMAGNSVRFTKKSSLLLAAALAIILISMFVIFVHLIQDHTAFIETVNDWHIILSIPLLVSAVTGMLMAFVAKRNFGMVNGDVLGATNEITRAFVLLTFLILLSVI